MARKGKIHGVTSGGCDIFIYLPLTKETFKLPDVQLSTKVFDLKKSLELVLGIPVNMQRLFYLDKEDLEDSCDLRSSDIVTSATLSMHIWRSWEKVVFNVFIGNELELVKLKHNEASCISNDQWKDRYQHQINVALYVAANKGKKELLDYLLTEGADVNWQTGLGRTPLHAAAARGRLECIKLLLERGAIADQLDKFGKTASRVASEHGFKESEKQLFLFQWQERAKTIKLKEPCSSLMMHQQFDSGYPTWLHGKCQQIYMCSTLPSNGQTNIKSDGSVFITAAKHDVQEELDEKEQIQLEVLENELSSDLSFLPRIEDSPAGHISSKRKVLKEAKTFDNWLMQKNLMAAKNTGNNLSTERQKNLNDITSKVKRKKEQEKSSVRHLFSEEKPRRRIDIYDTQEHNGRFEKEFLKVLIH